MLKATIVGNIGGDPDLRYSASGSPFLRFNVASNYRSRSPEGEWQDRTEWVRVTLLGKRAETLGQHLHRGTKVFVLGRLEARPWTDNQGQIRAGLEILADGIEFASQQAEGDRAPVPDLTNRQELAQDRVPVAAGAQAGDDVEDVPF